MYEITGVLDGVSRGSSLIESAYYEADTSTLIIDFDSNALDYYVYKNVPAEIWNAFGKATSLGRFYNSYIKGAYASDVVHVDNIDFDFSKWSVIQAAALLDDVAVPADEVSVAVENSGNYYEVKVMVQAESFADAANKATSAFGEESVSSITAW